MRDRVAVLWNTNNTFGFDRIDWPRLTRAAAVTTVSRYMRQQMWSRGLDPIVIPNGLPEETLGQPDRSAVHEFPRRTGDRFVLAKVGRYDPDKRWLLAIDTTALLRDIGWRPLLIVRGGVEPHGAEVTARAGERGLRVRYRVIVESPDPVLGLLETLTGLEETDVLTLRQPLGAESRRLLFRRLRPADVLAMRHHGVLTARRSAWAQVIRRNLLPRVELVLNRGTAPVWRPIGAGRPRAAPRPRPEHPRRRRIAAGTSAAAPRLSSASTS